MARLVATFTVLLTFVMPSYAQDGDTLAQWFSALRTADKEAFSELLTEDAKIINKAIQIVQNKEEYLESLDTWEEVAKDARIQYSSDRVDGERLVARVCYQFPSNAFTNIETFSIEDGKVFQVVQEKLKDGC